MACGNSRPPSSAARPLHQDSEVEAIVEARPRRTAPEGGILYTGPLRQETDATPSRVVPPALYEMLRASTQTRRLQYIDRLRTKQHELQAELKRRRHPSQMSMSRSWRSDSLWALRWQRWGTRKHLMAEIGAVAGEIGVSEWPS